MLKKDGQPWIPHGPRGSGNDLVGDEALAYRAASNSIERDLHPLEKIKEQLNRLEQVRWERPNPPVLETFRASDGTTWDVYAHLVKLPRSRILLCRPRNGPDWSVIQEFEEGSAYARNHGRTEVLVQGQNVREVVMAVCRSSQPHAPLFGAQSGGQRAENGVAAIPGTQSRQGRGSLDGALR